jgi:hypothetical protein
MNFLLNFMRPFLPMLFFVAASAAHAALPARDLGRGLMYYRVHQLPGDLPAIAAADKRADVLDLRYVAANAEGVSAVESWLKARATPRTPVFVLANSKTSGALLTALGTPLPGSGVIVLGAEAPGFSPNIAVKISSAEERRAYDALEGGASLESLLTDNPNKPRNDEARLAKEHLPDTGAADDSEVDDAPAANDKNAPAKVTPPIDAVLQRAVQIHRGLLALKKI